MYKRLVVVTRLADAEGVLRRIQETYEPEIFSTSVKEYQINASLPMSEDVHPDDYRDTPLCRVEVGMTDLTRDSCEALLSLIRGSFVIIDAFHGPLLAPTLETSLEVQQRHWKILEYRVLHEENCIWIAKAKRVHTFSESGKQEPIQTLLVKGWQCLSIDEKMAQTLLRFP